MSTMIDSPAFRGPWPRSCGSAALRATGDDRAVGGAAAPEQLHVYLPAQLLARQGLAAPLQGTVLPDPSLLQYPDGVGAGGFDGFLGFLDVGDLFFRLGAPQAVEELAVGREGDAAGPQLVGVDDAEVRRHDDRGVRGRRARRGGWPRRRRTLSRRSSARGPGCMISNSSWERSLSTGASFSARPYSRDETARYVLPATRRQITGSGARNPER